MAVQRCHGIREETRFLVRILVRDSDFWIFWLFFLFFKIFFQRSSKKSEKCLGIRILDGLNLSVFLYFQILNIVFTGSFLRGGFVQCSILSLVFLWMKNDSNLVVENGVDKIPELTSCPLSIRVQHWSNDSIFLRAARSAETMARANHPLAWARAKMMSLASCRWEIAIAGLRRRGERRARRNTA